MNDPPDDEDPWFDGLFDPDDIAQLLGLPDPTEPRRRRPVTHLPDIATWTTPPGWKDRT